MVLFSGYETPIYIVIFFTLLTLGSSGLVQAAETEEEYTQEFVEFIAGSGRGSYNFPVLMGEAELPYVDVELLLREWLEILVDCFPERQYCQTTIPPDATTYWLDAKSLLMGTSNNKDNLTLQKDELLFQEGKVWLRYDKLADWIPVSAAWTLYLYSLSVTPNFSTLKQRKELREVLREQHKQRHKEINLLQNEQEHRPLDENPVEFRYSASTEYANFENLGVSSYMQLLADISQGTLLTSWDIPRFDRLPTLSNIQYENREVPNVHLMSLGHMQSYQSLLNRSLNLTNGIKIQKEKRNKGAGTVEFNDTFRPFTEIDILKNGYIIETQHLDETGKFHFSERLASGGDVFTFNKYYQNGEESHDTIKIAPDSAKLLERSDWDYHLVYGQTSFGGFSQANIRYGLLNNLSVAFDTSHLAGEHSYNYNLTYRPFRLLNVDLELSQLEGEMNSVAALMFTLSNSQQLLLKYHRVRSDSLSAYYHLQQAITDRLWTLDHNIQLFRWNINSELTRQKDNFSEQHFFSRKISRRLMISGDYSRIKLNQAPIEKNYNLGLDYKLGRYGDIKVVIGKPLQKNNISLDYTIRNQYIKGLDTKWSAKLALSHIDGKTSAMLSAALFIKNSFIMSLDTDGKTVGLQFTFQNSMSTHRESIAFKEFGSATIYGTALSPPDSDGHIYPVQDLKLLVGGRTVTTDANGNFVHHSVAPNSRIKVVYDNNSLDANYIMGSAYSVIEARPGTRVELVPEILGSAGFDGVIVADKPLPEEAKLQILDIEDPTFSLEVSIEVDGYFVAEKVSPGNYLLQLIGVKQPPEPYELEILPEQDWVADIAIDYDNTDL